MRRLTISLGEYTITAAVIAGAGCWALAIALSRVLESLESRDVRR